MTEQQKMAENGYFAKKGNMGEKQIGKQMNDGRQCKREFW